MLLPLLYLFLGFSRIPKDCEEQEVLVDGVCVPVQCVSRQSYENVSSLGVCGGHGQCLLTHDESYECKCDEGFVPLEPYGCAPITCVKDNKWGCQEHAVCIVSESTYKCACVKTFTLVGEECVSNACVTYYTDLHTGHDVATVCGNGGVCILRADEADVYSCVCNASFVQLNTSCASVACYMDEDTSKPVCSGHGFCNGTVCLCERFYDGVYCDIDVPCDINETFIAGVCVSNACVTKRVLPDGSTVFEVCNNHGVCTQHQKAQDARATAVCDCADNFVGLVCDACPEGFQQLEKSSIVYNLTSPNFSSPDICLPTACILNGTQSLLSPRDDKKYVICGNHGTCSIAEAKCVCDQAYVFNQSNGCLPAACYNATTGAYCTGGKCVNEHCECNTDQEVYHCECVSILCEDPGTKVVCNDHGSCVDTACKCDVIYAGEFCTRCSDVSFNISGRCVHSNCAQELPGEEYVECNGAGLCQLNPHGDYECVCSEGYILSQQNCVKNDCVNQTGHICSDHGVCFKGACVCAEGYKGDLCDKTA